MSSLILFINCFLSYLLVFAVVVVLIAVAIKIGILLREKKNIEESESRYDK